MKIELNTAIDLALGQASENAGQDRESLMIMDTISTALTASVIESQRPWVRLLL